jgi:hypothetical protein
MFKTMATLTAVTAVTMAFALPAHAIYVGNTQSANGTQLNALNPNGIKPNGTEVRVEQPRLLTIELPTE